MSSRSLPPRVLYQEIDGVKCEPIERLVVDVPADCVGAVMEKIGSRKGDLLGDDPRGRPDEGGVPGPRPRACSATATSSLPTPRARASWPPSLTATPP